MNLIDFIKDIENIDDELIIFQESKEDYKSDIILDYGETNDGGIKNRDDKKFHYLIEVFLAKEFIEDWLNNLNYSPTPDQIAKRLFEYGVNDA